MPETAANTAVKKDKIKFKDILNRNLVLIIFIQILSNMSLNMINAFASMNAKALGVSVAAIGIGASVTTIVALLTRMPAGTLADSDKKKIALIIVIIARALAQFLLVTFGCTNDTNYMIARGVYGITWSFAGVILPAVVAMMMDKKVMGSTFAIIAIINNFTKDMAKALGVQVYKTNGVVPAAMIGIGFALAAVVLILFLDFNDERIKRATPKVRKPLLKSLNFKYIPLCLILSLAVFNWTQIQNYNNIIAQDRGIELASILVIAGIFASISGFVCSALCDFIHPKYVLIALYCCMAAGSVVIGGATTYTTFLVGQVLCTIGVGYSSIISIYLFKNCALTEKGSVQATNYFATDILSAVAGALCGGVTTAMGYQGSYTVFAVTSVVAAVIVLFFGGKLLPKAAED